MLLSAVGVAAVCLLPAGGSAPVTVAGALVTVDVDALEPAPLRAGARVAIPAPVVPVTLPRSAPVRVTIPELGVRSAVMALGIGEDGAMEVPPGAYPAGWFDRGPTPGELGPAVLAGHVDWDGETGVFGGLHRLHRGDRVLVDRADGSTATFAVDRVAQYAKDEFPAGSVYGDIDEAGLRLITCGGDFDTDADSYQDNVVVYASLVP
ncbi:Peptidase C60 sortase A and B (fragment) [Modestobacter italicus]|uniref:Peptidase C60 sortase A and B n=1 Tax=Modestobacter italicus (strain DSM 44449 / CECT 9708 / BC 501) TaxID=2732864 RepID=I4F1S4_MODI5